MCEQKVEFSRADTKALSPHTLALVRECGTGPSGVLLLHQGDKGEREVKRCWERSLDAGCSRTTFTKQGHRDQGIIQAGKDFRKEISSPTCSMQDQL